MGVFVSKRKGSVAFNTIVVLVFGLLVLLLLGTFFSGGFSSLSGKAVQFGAASTDSANAASVAECNRLCGQVTDCGAGSAITQYITNDCKAVLGNTSCAMVQACTDCILYDTSSGVSVYDASLCKLFI